MFFELKGKNLTFNYFCTMPSARHNLAICHMLDVTLITLKTSI